MRWGLAYFAVQAVAGAGWWVAVFTSPVVGTLTLGDLDPVAVAALDIPLFVIASAAAAAGVRFAAIVSTTWTALVAVSLTCYATVTAEAGWGVLSMLAAATGSVVALSIILLGHVPTEWLVRGPFAFRSAKRRGTVRTYLAATFAQILVFWGLFLVVIPLGITALEQRWSLALVLPGFLRAVGIAVLVAASVLGLASAFVMSRRGGGTPLPAAMPTRLVVSGPYRWVRNPMAVAGIAQGAAVGLILSSWLVIVYAIAGSLLWNYAIRPHEEADLEKRFGDEFVRYRDTVTCWVPRAPRVRMLDGRAAR